MHSINVPVKGIAASTNILDCHDIESDSSVLWFMQRPSMVINLQFISAAWLVCKTQYNFETYSTELFKEASNSPQFQI